MKYILIIGDGMADNPVPELSSKTPLQYAEIPCMDAMAARGEVGEVITCPRGLPPGSDTAILSIFGADPRVCYTGRSPLEAAASGLKLAPGDVSYRCNMVAYEDGDMPFGDRNILSHSAGSIEGAESIELVEYLFAHPDFAPAARAAGMVVHPAPSFRHIAVQSGADIAGLVNTPPHDVLDRPIGPNLPRGGANGPVLADLMERAYHVLNDHPINQARRAAGRLPANGIWFWAEGTAVALDSFYDKYQKRGTVVSAVPLCHGIARLVGLDVAIVPGATGELDTNYEGKVAYALDALRGGANFAAIHLEAPDECTHNGDLPGKLEAIRRLDSRIVAPLVAAMEEWGEPFRLLILSDHKTLTSTRGHDGDPVPYLLYDSRIDTGRGLPYCEASGAVGPHYGHGAAAIMPLLFEQNRAGFDGLGFYPADILLPTGCDLPRWSVVACDQYTAQPDYWARVDKFVGAAPSALRLIIPEAALERPDVARAIERANETMTQYVKGNIFTQLGQSMVYVERTLQNGAVRHGIVGMIDLEEYEHRPGATTLIRATEGTIAARIPPRVSVRENAALELPHVLLLADDPAGTVIAPLAAQRGEMEPLYDFTLMEGGGSIKGWKLGDAQLAAVARALRTLARPDAFAARYDADGAPLLLFAVGDGNHSLAAAKACYEARKAALPPEQWAALPARYALVELGNVHDESLVFEPIHRLALEVEPRTLLDALMARYPGAYEGEGEGHVLRYIHAGGQGAITVPHPEAQIEVGTLDRFLDGFGCKVDYIHGDDVLAELSARPGRVGFLLPVMGKGALFPTVMRDGALPRKTFSMGEAHDKRFYLEARAIR